jgi:hypothetical protein
MTDEEVQSILSDIKAIVEDYLARISGAIQQPKTLDQLVEDLNGLIGPSTMTRNLQRASGFFYTFFMQPRHRSNKDAFRFSEETLDRLRDLELQLESRLSAQLSTVKATSGSSLSNPIETVSQDLKGLKRMTEDLEAQTQGFTDSTNKYSAKYPVDFIILSAHNIWKMIRRLEIDYRHLSGLPEYKVKRDEKQLAFHDDAIEILKILFSRFHYVVRALGNRHSKRPAFEIKDEYDVQDLLYSLLELFFDDIRPEEWTPSFAGSPVRMDILLKKKNLVVECKKPRKGLGAKEVGNQLILDIDRYKKHPDCKTLVCFVYDADNIIRNPKGLCDDIESKSTSDFQVLIYIEP